MGNPVDREHARHTRDLDPLLPELPDLDAGDGEVIITAEIGGSQGRALARFAAALPDSNDALWGALRRYSLVPRLAGSHRTAVFRELLGQWLSALVLPVGDWDTTVAVTVPSRDPDYRIPLLELGFAPLIGVLVRPRGAPMPPAPPGHLVRTAGCEDLDRLGELTAALQRYDVASGVLTERERVVELAHQMVADYWSGAPGWTWVVGPRARPAGFLQVQRPEQAVWMAEMSIAGGCAAYLGEAYVEPAARGCGAGRALASAAHAALDDAGIPLTMLHVALPNPLSVPFWHRMGYRPLWTMWQRRPASGPVI